MTLYHICFTADNTITGGLKHYILLKYIQIASQDILTFFILKKYNPLSTLLKLLIKVKTIYNNC